MHDAEVPEELLKPRQFTTVIFTIILRCNEHWYLVTYSFLYDWYFTIQQKSGDCLDFTSIGYAGDSILYAATSFGKAQYSYY